jgi:hypothetical protein
MLLESTPICRWLPNPAERDSYTMTRDRTLNLLKTLPEVARIAGPKLTVAHVLCPHPPFVFGPDGEDVSAHHMPYYLSDGQIYTKYYGGTDAEYIKGYRAQAEFLTKSLLPAIDGILANSAEPPIIIVQSDHGSGKGLHTLRADRTDHWERMSILNAFHFPGGKRAGLQQRITPVNTFRIIFNHYFGAHLDLLPERSYYSSWPEPRRFVDVTEQARTPRKRIP